MFALMPLGAQAQSGPNILRNIPVTGPVDGQTFVGNLTITELAFEAGQLLASGVLRGTVNGTRINQAFEDVVIGLSEGGSSAVCDILFLDIGPIFLDLLGLQVDLSQITLDIDAVPGSGNLLGNLLCAVAGLLDPPILGIGDAIVNILNNILDAINQLL